MPFNAPAQLQHHPDRNLWEVLRDLTWSEPGNPLTYTSPAGSLTDLASTPRLAWFLIPPMDRHIVEPAIIHDALYKRKGQNGHDVMSRAQCDDVLYRAMKDVGAPWWYRDIVYVAVRLFGGFAWAKETP